MGNNKNISFISPAVQKIINKENISFDELLKIKGSGLNGRIRKTDVLNYLKIKKTTLLNSKNNIPLNDSTNESDFEIVEMSRIRKIIAEHMVRSIHTSAHVTNFIETDVTNLVNWREKNKDEFFKKENIKLTYLPVIVYYTSKTLKKFPYLNASIEGDKIILKKKINIGIAVALDNYNLIVPVIKNVDKLNIIDIAKEINRLVILARTKKLSPDDIRDGTFSITNLGSFKNLAATPIINQPQVAVLGIGSIEKKPSVVETSEGDMIAIRQKMILSLSYDHRIIDGALAGEFLYSLKTDLENFNNINLL